MDVIAEKQPWEVRQARTLAQTQELKGRKSFGCWSCMRRLKRQPGKEAFWWRSGFEGVGSYPIGSGIDINPAENILLSSFTKTVEGREDVPYCPACGKPLLYQAKWTGIKKGLKYPLVILLLTLVLRVVAWLLSKEVLFS